MSNLVYFAIGYNDKFIDVVNLAIRYFRLKNPTIAVMVICDESFMEKCANTLPRDTLLFSVPNTTDTTEATLNKLRIFDAIQNTNFKRIMYIDSDILVDRNIDSILYEVKNEEKLYAFYENSLIESHNNINWSLKNYSEAYLEFFRERKIYVFNTGLFAFMNTPQMKEHFKNTIELIESYKDEEHFLEQSGMNVYFNKRDLVDGSLITSEVYNMYYPFDERCRNKIIHFAGSPGKDDYKIGSMRHFMVNFLLDRIVCPSCSCNFVLQKV